MLTWLRRLELRLFGPPADRAWRPSTRAQRFAGYDQDQARVGLTRARARAQRVRRAPMPGQESVNG